MPSILTNYCADVKDRTQDQVINHENISTKLILAYMSTKGFAPMPFISEQINYGGSLSNSKYADKRSNKVLH